jgi:hypothetical protein
MLWAYRTGAPASSLNGYDAILREAVRSDGRTHCDYRVGALVNSDGRYRTWECRVCGSHVLRDSSFGDNGESSSVISSRPMTQAGWSDFLVAEVGAAAALTGLIFVAVSINLAKIVEYPGISTRAAETITMLLGVLVMCSVALVPNQTNKMLGLEFLVAGLTLWLIVTIRHATFRFREAGHLWWWFATRVVLCQLATIPFVLAGVSLILGWHGAMYWLVPGCVISFLTAVYSAWVLLIEIIR